MTQLKAKELRKQDADKLKETLFDLRSEFSKLKGEADRGIVKKDVGNIRRIRRSIAMILTVMHEKGIVE
ncbi:MAG: 50S ribosomal protein L29 [Nitrososphaerales archaeon]|jgi:ribosomal protein L29